MRALLLCLLVTVSIAGPAAGASAGSGRLRPGDLVFSHGGGHVALVVSKTMAISSPRPGARVHYVSLAYFRGDFAGARRLLN